jgi:hypothetical protein
VEVVGMRGLSEFVLARATDDEELARQYGDPGALRSGLAWASDVNRPVLEVDPSRMVAECEAKRRVVAQFVDAVANYEADAGPQGEVTRLRFVLRALALPYADHPDYQPEWRI